MAVGAEMEKEFESKLRLQQQQQGTKQQAMQRANSIAFRAPQEQFTIDDFELGKMYGTGSYSKVHFFFLYLIGFYTLIFWILTCDNQR